MFRLVTVVLALSASALATLFTTAPVASTTWQAGIPQTIAWQESTDGAKPTLQDFGPAMISVYVGNAQQQTRLQSIATNANVSTNSSIVFTPDPKMGPNGNFYFIRFESLGLKDATQPQFPALAFSAKFTLSGMTGTFSPEISSQIAGASTAPIGGTTTVAAGATTVTRNPTPTLAVASSTTKPTASASAKPNAADVNVRYSGFALAAAAAVMGVVLA